MEAALLCKKNSCTQKEVLDCNAIQEDRERLPGGYRIYGQNILYVIWNATKYSAGLLVQVGVTQQMAADGQRNMTLRLCAVLWWAGQIDTAERLQAEEAG